MDSQKPPGIRVNQIFLSKALFEHSPESMELPTNTPVGEHALNITLATGVSEDQNEGIVTITVQTTSENTGHYRFILEMVLLVAREEANGNLSIAEYVASGGGPTLFPFLREAVANLTGRGRFGPVWLKPINFVKEFQSQAAE